MKHLLCSIFVLFLFLSIQVQVRGQSYSITETVNSGVFYFSGTTQSTPTIFHELVVVAIDSCDYSTSTLPAWFTSNYTKVHDFFNAATFGNFNYAVNWLTKDATHAYIMPRSNVPKFDGSCEHVHSQSNILAVLADVDAQTNFADYDYDNDGIVSVHFTSINITGTHNGGVTGGTCFTYTSNDYNSNGTRIVVHVDRQTRGISQNAYFGVFFHESGHSLFNFPDMDHSGSNDFNHYGIGGFDVMSGGGFQGVSSPYNPWFRQARSWFTPTSITSDGTLTLQDFQTYGQCYVYSPSSLPSNSIANEKYYISYHKPTNQFYATWPYKNSTLGGVIIWHVKKTSPSLYDDYSDYRTMDIAIKAAHGKYVWSESSSAVTNTGVENALTGRDSLEIRKIALNSSGYYGEIQGPYYAKDKGGSSIFYTPSVMIC